MRWFAAPWLRLRLANGFRYQLMECILATPSCTALIPHLALFVSQRSRGLQNSDVAGPFLELHSLNHVNAFPSALHGPNVCCFTQSVSMTS